MKAREKRAEIEAIQWTGNNFEELRWFTGRQMHITPDGDLLIWTRHGHQVAKVGDWIIKGVKGEVYPCKPDIFERTYEPVTSTGWVDRPDREGYWWMAPRIDGGYPKVLLVQVIDFPSMGLAVEERLGTYVLVNDYLRDYYPHSKWQYIPTPQLLEMEK